MAYIFGSIWDRLNRNALNDLSKSVEQQGKSIQDLVAEGQLTPEQYSELIESVNGMISKGDVSIYDIDKNKGKFDGTYFSSDFLEALGDGVIETTNVLPRSITMDKTAFYKTGKNIFNKNDVDKGFLVSESSGDLFPSANFSTSKFMPIESNEKYTATNVYTVSFYESSEKYINTVSISPSPKTITTPSNAKLIKITVTNTNLNISQVEKGGNSTNFEAFRYYIDDKYIDPEILIPEFSPVKIEETAFYKTGKNMFDKGKVKTGFMISESSGNEFASANYSTSSEIAVSSGESYSYQNVWSVSYYTSVGGYIKTETIASEPSTLVSPNNATIVILSLVSSMINSAQMEKGDTVTPYENFRYLIDEKYLDIQGGTSTYNQDVTALKVLAESNASNNIPNVPYGLDIPSYEGSGQVTHPSVLYFKNGWNGYKFWMAMTPYPNADAQYENPSIVTSNDNVVWHEPASNPIAPLPADRAFQSDPCIFMRGSTMELWYREHIQISGGYTTELWRKTSTDGINWTNKEKLFDNNSFEVVRSQTVRYIDGKYCMWYHTGETNSTYHIKYAESVDGKNWTNAKALNISFPSNHVPWHLDVIVENGKTEIIISSKTTDNSKWSLFYTSSYDNENFHSAIEIIKPDKRPGKWDSTDLYRSAFVMVDGKYYVYYATPYKIGLTVGDEIITLNQNESNAIKSEVIMSSSNSHKNSDSPSSYPLNKIVYTKVFDGDYGVDHGFPTSAGTVVTHRIIGETGHDFQLYYPQSTNDIYRRRSTSAGWATWTKFMS